MSSQSSVLAKQALDFLSSSSSSYTALQISKGIGLSTAKEINPTLYSLERQGFVEKSMIGSKISWKSAGSSIDGHMKKLKSTENQARNDDDIGNEDIDKRFNPQQSNIHSISSGLANISYYMDGDNEMDPQQEEEGPEKLLHEDFYHRKRSHDKEDYHEEVKGKTRPEDLKSMIPKAPHQIMKSVGPRTAMLAEALHRQPINERMATEHRVTQNHPQSFHDMNEMRHQPDYDFPNNRPFRMQSFHEHSTGIHRQREMEREHREHFEEFGSENDERLADKIMEFLKQFKRPLSTLEIVRAVHRKTKRDVNPTLYNMENRGMIMKTSMHPPAWKIATSHSATTSFQAPKDFERQPVNRTRQNEVGYQESSWSVPRPNFLQSDQRARQLSWPGEEEVRPSSSQDIRPSSKQPIFPSQATSSIKNEIVNDVSSSTFIALNKNPVSAINEYAQRNHIPISFELVHEGQGGPNRFVVAVKMGDRMYNAVSAGNMKDAKKEAADVALREVLCRQETAQPDSQSSIKGISSMTHFDKVAMLSLRKFMMLSNEVQDKFAGRKVIAAIIKQTYDDESGTVVSIGAGNRCITGDRLTLDGKTLNDSHAEIICRRAFVLYLYSELEKFYANNESIFEEGGMNGKLQVKDGITWHLYISTAPCGDGALFTPRDVNQSCVSGLSRDHVPLYDSKQQGLLRTKVEDGEGTIPIDPNDGLQTWDGIVRGNRLRTMSCSDKICKWNVLGLQGALLSHIIEPIYLESLTLGYLYEHGHLARATCCRLCKDSDINEKLPLPYSLNHPWLGRVTAYSPSRETQKTNNLSVNWFIGSSGIELTDGRTGACLSRTASRPTPSRLCKSELYKVFKGLCSNRKDQQQLLCFETYREAKEKSLGFQEAKAVMNKQFKFSKFGDWVKKPRELEMFDV